jgi:hypothetical protein
MRKLFLPDWMPVFPIRLSKLLWVPAVLAIFGWMEAVGTAHLLTTYRWAGSAEHKVYLSCDYVGRFTQRITPENGKCDWIAFLKP